MLKILVAFIRRDFLEQNRYGPFWIGQFGFILLQVISTYFTAKLFNGNPALTPYGGDYFIYATLGALTLQLLGATLQALPMAVYRAQTQGTLEPMLTSPTPLLQVLVAASGFALVSEALSLIFFSGIAGWVAPLFWAKVHWGALVGLVLLHGLCGWSLGLLTASLGLAFKVTPPVGTLVTILCSSFAGVVYPVAVLPEPLQILAHCLPFTYGMAALRAALVGQVDGLGSLIFMIFTLGIFWVAQWIFQRALGVAYRDGTLTYQ